MSQWVALLTSTVKKESVIRIKNQMTFDNTAVSKVRRDQKELHPLCLPTVWS